MTDHDVNDVSGPTNNNSEVNTRTDMMVTINGPTSVMTCGFGGARGDPVCQQELLDLTSCDIETTTVLGNGILILL